MSVEPLFSPTSSSLHGVIMTESYSRAVLRVAAAQICQSLGWDAVQVSAVDILTDVLQRYIEQLARCCHRYGELCKSCGTGPTVVVVRGGFRGPYCKLERVGLERSLMQVREGRTGEVPHAS